MASIQLWMLEGYLDEAMVAFVPVFGNYKIFRLG